MVEGELYPQKALIWTLSLVYNVVEGTGSTIQRAYEKYGVFQERVGNWFWNTTRFGQSLRNLLEEDILLNGHWHETEKKVRSHYDPLI